MNNRPQITRLPGTDQIKRLVEEIVVPEIADQQVKALTELLYSAANAESEEQFEIAEIASRHAFAQTSVFEAAFRDFVGFPATGFIPDAQTIDLNREV